MSEIMKNYRGFDWDFANLHKNWRKHYVLPSECEEIFFNTPLLIEDDVKHSQHETRLFALGKTNLNRRLFVVFTTRNQLIRIISARDMSRKERGFYEKIEDNT